MFFDSFSDFRRRCYSFMAYEIGHTGEKSIQALAKQDLLKGVKTCKLKFCEHCVLKRRPK